MTETSPPIHIFPAEIQAFILGISASCGSPPGYAMTAVLSAGSVLARNCCLKVKTGYTEYPNIYCALVGKPGVVKSPPMSLALAPLYAKQSAKWSNYNAALEEWAKELKILKQTGKRQEISAHEANAPKPPLCSVINQGTTEGIRTTSSAGINPENRRSC